MALVDTAEEIVDITAQEIARQADVLEQALGERPFGHKKLSERERVRRYNLLRDDPTRWHTLLTAHPEEDVVNYALSLEKMRQRYPDEDLPELPTRNDVLGVGIGGPGGAGAEPFIP